MEREAASGFGELHSRMSPAPTMQRARGPVARVRAAGLPRRHGERRRGGAAERRHSDLASPRRARRQALLPLARRPRQRDRLGRPARRLRRPGRARRRDRGGAARARAAAAGPLPARLRPRRRAPLLVRRGRLAAARAGRRGAAPHRRAAACRRRPRRRRPGDDGGAGGPGRAARRGRRRRNRPPRRRRDPGAGLVTPDPRRPRGGLRRGRRLDRVPRARAAPVGARRRPQSRVLASAAAAVAAAPASSRREHEGLPAYVPNGEPAIFDGRIRLRLPRGRRRG